MTRVLVWTIIALLAGSLGVLAWSAHESWWMNRVFEASRACTGTKQVFCICQQLAEWPPVHMSYCEHAEER